MIAVFSNKNSHVLVDSENQSADDHSHESGDSRSSVKSTDCVNGKLDMIIHHLEDLKVSISLYKLTMHVNHIKIQINKAL